MSAGKRTGYASLPLHGGKAPPSPCSMLLRLRGPCAPRPLSFASCRRTLARPRRCRADADRSRLRTDAREVLRASGSGAPRALTKDVRAVLVCGWIAAVCDRLGRSPTCPRGTCWFPRGIVDTGVQGYVEDASSRCAGLGAARSQEGRTPSSGLRATSGFSKPDRANMARAIVSSASQFRNCARSRANTATCH